MRKILIVLAVCASLILSTVGLGSSANAIDCTSNTLTAQQQLQCGTCGAAGQKTCGDIDTEAKKSSDRLSKTVENILNVLSLLVGIIAVIMVVVAGFRYVTSGGKQESVSAAKNTLLYAVVGLVIVALAQAIVHFVLRNIK